MSEITEEVAVEGEVHFSGSWDANDGAETLSFEGNDPRIHRLRAEPVVCTVTHNGGNGTHSP
jgi:hypothetical protein